jgi:hypothetical protein
MLAVIYVIVRIFILYPLIAVGSSLIFIATFIEELFGSLHDFLTK